MAGYCRSERTVTPCPSRFRLTTTFQHHSCHGFDFCNAYIVPFLQPRNLRQNKRRLSCLTRPIDLCFVADKVRFLMRTGANLHYHLQRRMGHANSPCYTSNHCTRSSWPWSGTYCQAFLHTEDHEDVVRGTPCIAPYKYQCRTSASPLSPRQVPFGI